MTTCLGLIPECDNNCKCIVEELAYLEKGLITNRIPRMVPKIYKAVAFLPHSNSPQLQVPFLSIWLNPQSSTHKRGAMADWLEHLSLMLKLPGSKQTLNVIFLWLIFYWMGGAVAK